MKNYCSTIGRSMQIYIYKSLPKDDKRSYLPDKFSTNWDNFSQLYLDTFGEPIGYNYKFICGPGVERYC